MSSNTILLDPDMIARASAQYNASNPQPSHFTQVVWKGTTQVGCAVATCNNIFPAKYGPAKYYVCEYYPQGNIIGQFPCVVTASFLHLTRAYTKFALQSERFRIIAVVAVVTGLWCRCIASGTSCVYTLQEEDDTTECIIE